jgi:hypothetical protein
MHEALDRGHSREGRADAALGDVFIGAGSIDADEGAERNTYARSKGG